MKRSTARVLARFILQALSAWKGIHRAADRFQTPLKKAVRRAFRKGQQELDMKALRRALMEKDEAGVLEAVSVSIEATEKQLGSTLRYILGRIIEVSGTAAAKRVHATRTLRAAAEVKGFAFDVTNPKAQEWIRDHAAETVSGVSRTTRQAIRDLVDAAFEEQFDVEDLADEISATVGIDPARAETIARTETIRASNQGQQLAWDQAVEEGLLTGDEKQTWIVTPDDRLCPICEPLDGQTVALGAQFAVDGDFIDSPPAHPNCRCTVGLV